MGNLNFNNLNNEQTWQEHITTNEARIASEKSGVCEKCYLIHRCSYKLEQQKKKPQRKKWKLSVRKYLFLNFGRWCSYFNSLLMIQHNSAHQASANKQKSRRIEKKTFLLNIVPLLIHSLSGSASTSKQESVEAGWSEWVREYRAES